MKYIIAIAFFALSVNAYAQLGPGETSFENKWVKNDSYKMAWYRLKDTAKIKMAEIVVDISTDKKTLTAILHVNMPNAGAWVDSSIAVAKTLDPIYHSSFNGQRDMVLHFGKKVTGYYNDKTKKTNTAIDNVTSAAYFDSNLYPVLLGWLPLKEGYNENIAIYDYNPAAKIGVISASVTDTKSGVYQTEKNGPRDVWILTVTDEIAPATSFYYFDKADRRLWKQEIVMGQVRMLIVREE